MSEQGSVAAMLNIPRRLRRRLLTLFIVFFVAFNVSYLILPGDSSLRLAVNFNTARFSNLVRGAATDRDAWLREPARHPVDLRSDVGYLLKTGYGTRIRIPAQLEAYSLSGGMLGHEGQDYVVVGDWTTVNETDAKLLGAEIHDAVRMVLDSDVGKRLENHPRFRKYAKLQAAIRSGDEGEALYVGQTHGWELDALKFISGMDLMHRQMPDKKWYIILDDDTYMIPASLELLLTHLNPNEPHYIGNAVGDFKGRFAHGGSGVVLSGQAMRLLFSRQDVVAASYQASLDETFGDKLVATTLQKLSIYLDERYSHYFNGEPPAVTRMWSDRLCAPLMSFHRVRNPGDMVAIAQAVGRAASPVRWAGLWELFGPTPLRQLAAAGTQRGLDHVGKPDEHVRTWTGVKTAEACRRKCDGGGRSWCLAWTHVPRTSECYGSPWMVIGARAAKDTETGLNWPRVEALMRSCE